MTFRTGRLILACQKIRSVKLSKRFLGETGDPLFDDSLLKDKPKEDIGEISLISAADEKIKIKKRLRKIEEKIKLERKSKQIFRIG